MTDAEAIRSMTTYDPETGDFRWSVRHGSARAGDPVGGKWADPDGRKRTSFMGKRCQIAVLIWLRQTGQWPKGQVDHRDQSPANCAWSNLRDVTRRMNQQNERRPRRSNTTGYLGVQKRRSRFAAVIETKGRRVALGTFDTAEAASAAYVAAKRQIHEGCTL